VWEEVTMVSDEMARALKHYVGVRAAVASGGSIAEIRAAFHQNFGHLAFPVPADVEVEEVDAGGTHAFWVTAPGVDTDRVIVYIHGGGFVMGEMPDVETGHFALASTIGRTAGARVLSVDYRLVPEAQFPAPVDDVLAAYRWLLDQGVDPARVAFAGESVGGGLTIVALMAIRDAGLPLPSAGVSVSALSDFTFSSPSYVDANKDPVIVREGGLMRFAELYLGDTDRRTPYASPVFGDFSGLPPMLFLVGSSEALRDDTYRMVDAAREVGADVTLREWEAPHSWIQFVSFLPEAVEAVDVIAEFVASRTEKAAG
jgi:epsilon-lactone hydrolase